VENYLVAMGVFAGLYALMALGLNVIWGLAGMVNLGLVGFFAIGAYASALLTVRLHWAVPFGLGAGIVIAAAAGIVVALITARLQGDYLAIVTLGFAEVIRLIAGNEIWLTNGTDGISAIPQPFRGVLSPAAFNLAALALVWVAVAGVGALFARLSGAPFGRVLRAIREDETVASVAGKRVLWFKLRAFALGAGVLGLAGGLYAHYVGYIAPDSFSALVTIYIVLALTAGGTGNMGGAVIGAVLVVVLTEGTRFMGQFLTALSPVQIASLREGLIGMLLIVVLHWRPQGIFAERAKVYAL